MNRLAKLPEMYSEEEAAEILGISRWTLRRERAAGNIGFIMLARKPRYTMQMISEYLERNTTCPTKDTKSDNTGSHSDADQTDGAGPGTTTILDKHAAHRSAQQILKGQS